MSTFSWLTRRARFSVPLDLLGTVSANPNRPRGDRETGIITQLFVASTSEMVSGQVRNTSKLRRKTDRALAP